MSTEFQFGYPFELGVPQRRWLCFNSSQIFLNDSLCSVTFNVMSYNILSQKLLKQHMYLYKHSPSDALQWEYRSKMIIWEIRCHSVDILCLQELEECDYDDTFKPQLFELGYESIYKKKTGSKTDGCAIFFKKHAFSLDRYVAVEFKRPQEALLNRDNIGLVALFKPLGLKDENLKLCVSTTHLLFNPKRGDVKLVQLRLLLAEIDKMAFRGISPSNAPEYHPVIMCGDFNSVPFSPLYNFITDGSICCANMLTGNVSGQSEGLNKGSEMWPKCIDLSSLGIDERCRYVDFTNACSLTHLEDPSRLSQPVAVKLEDVTLPDTHLLDCVSSVEKDDNKPLAPDEENGFMRKPKKMKTSEDELFYHNFNFASAYKHFALDGAMEVSTYHSKAQCTVDYIFYSQPTAGIEHDSGSERKQRGSLLVALGVYSLFSGMEMDLLGGLPNWTFPSDHMSLITRFALFTS